MSVIEQKTFEKDQLNNEICVVVGTRPGIVMFAPIIHELKRTNSPFFILHTGQHYSPNMDSQFFDDLQLPQPDYRIEGVSEHRTHGGQTSVMLKGVEDVLLKRRPKVILVGGDANTNLAAAIAARKLQMIVGHIEAGMRSYDWRMPEEHNRVMIDHISDILFASDNNAVRTLENEKIRGEILMVGNPIVDASIQNLELAKKKSKILQQLGVENGKYLLLTTHREENVDSKANLENSLLGVSKAAEKLGLPVIFLAHPRTEKRMQEFGLRDWAEKLPNMRIHSAIGYLDFLVALSNAKLFFTDSGGGQQEACVHHIPCITLRDNTEWTETIDIGANRLTGCNVEKIMAAVAPALAVRRDWSIPFGDGTCAQQIVAAAKKALVTPPILKAVA